MTTAGLDHPSPLPLVRLGQGDFVREVWPRDLEHHHDHHHGEPMPPTSQLQQIQKGRNPKPRRVMLYGTHGIGKSTFGAMAEAPIFIPTEDGLGDIECESFPLAQSLGQVMSYLESLYTGEHGYRTVVIDSLDWLERLIWAEICADESVENIEKIGYAKGYTYAIDKWRAVLGALDALRSDRGIGVILLAHAKIERFDNPETEPYDRYSPRLQKLASALVQEWCDEVLFATYRVHTRKVDEGFNKAKHQGIGTGERIIRTVERPAHVAKNRIGLPEEFALDYRVFAALLRGEQPAPDTSATNTPTPTPTTTAAAPAGEAAAPEAEGV
ncbi:MAG: ATP-binding protein [Phycisphaeraceae bacterium]|nr:ATP-binding protein [Phycisphaeraceae bacterium]